MQKRDSNLKLQIDKTYKNKIDNKSQKFPLLSNKYKKIKIKGLSQTINSVEKNSINPEKNMTRTTSAFLKRNYNNYLLKIAERNAPLNSTMIKVHELNAMLYKLKKYDNELITYNRHKLEQINQLQRTVRQNESKLKKIYDLQDINLPNEKISIHNFNEIKLSKVDIEKQLYDLIQEKEKVDYNLKNEEEYNRSIEYMLENEKDRLFNIKKESFEVEEKIQNVKKYQKIVNDNTNLNSKKEEDFNKLKEDIFNDINLVQKVKEEQDYKNEKIQNKISIKENEVKELEETIKQLKAYENIDMKKAKDDLKNKVENAKDFQKKRISDEKKCIEIIFCLYIIQKYLYEEKNFDKNKIIESDEYQLLLQINNEEKIGMSQEIKNKKEFSKTYNEKKFKAQDDLLNKENKAQLNTQLSSTKNVNKNFLSTSAVEETKLNSTSKNFYINNNMPMFQTLKLSRNSKNNTLKKLFNKTQQNLFKASSDLSTFYSSDINNLNALLNKFNNIKITKNEISNYISRILSKLDFYVSQINILHKKELNLEEKKSENERKVKDIISNNFLDFEELTKNNQKCKKFIEENNEFINMMKENNNKNLMNKMLEKINTKDDFDKFEENSINNNDNNEENIIFKLAKNIIMKINNFFFICSDLLKDIIIAKDIKKLNINKSDDNVEAFIKQNNLEDDKNNEIIQTYLKLMDFQKNEDIIISNNHKLLLQYIEQLMKFCQDNDNVLSKQDLDEINKNLIGKFYIAGNPKEEIDLIFTERFLAKNTQNFNNIFNHFFSLGDEVKDNVILIYDLIHNNENTTYLEDNNLHASTKELNYDSNLGRRLSITQKKSRGSIANSNDSVTTDNKSKTRRKHADLHSAYTVDVQKQNYIGLNKFAELCPDEPDNDSDETSSTKKIVIKKKRRITSIEESIINKLYTPFLKKTKYLRKLNPNIPEIKHMTSSCSKAYYNIKKMKGDVAIMNHQMKIYNNPHINVNQLSDNTYNFLVKLIQDNPDKSVKKRAKSNRFRIKFGEK